MVYIVIFFTSLLLSFIFGIVLIPFLRNLNIKQSVSSHLNERHSKKQGTPTMGGLIFVLPTIIMVILLIIIRFISLNVYISLILFIFICYALLGFIDDYLKVIYHNNKGISIIHKFTIELIIALVFFSIFLIYGNKTSIDIYFFSIDLKFLYGIFILFLFSGSSNAVNITDGLDGLCAGCIIFSLSFYMIFALHHPFIPGSKEIIVVSIILIASLLSFLYFNFYPAKVFMGDLGSLALGGILASFAIILKIELSLVFIGVVFIFETICSFVQIIAIRYFNIKVFKKAPFHHHLEELGFLETDILKIFYLLSLVILILSLVLYLYIF